MSIWDWLVLTARVGSSHTVSAGCQARHLMRTICYQLIKEARAHLTSAQAADQSASGTGNKVRLLHRLAVSRLLLFHLDTCRVAIEVCGWKLCKHEMAGPSGT